MLSDDEITELKVRVKMGLWINNKDGVKGRPADFGEAAFLQRFEAALIAYPENPLLETDWAVRYGMRPSKTTPVSNV